MVFRRGSQPLGALRWLFEHRIDWETPVAPRVHGMAAGRSATVDARPP